MRQTMNLSLLILVSCLACSWAATHEEQCISTNYDAMHRNEHTRKGSDESSISTNYDARHKNEHGTVVARSVANRHPYLHREKRQTIVCDSSAKFRSADGTCNNLNNPSWGSVDQLFLRMQDPAYDDGKMTPRLKKTNGDSLPSARTVSTGVHDFDRRRLSPRASVLLMEWGQFLAHDLTGTPVDDATNTTCCDSDSLVTDGTLHPDVSTGGRCFPIIIAEGDRHFTDVSNRCMEFVRSAPTLDSNGVRQQKNILSSYLDGTNVYGRNQAEMDALRDSVNAGKLRVKDNNLPESTDNYCIKDNTGDYCLEAGDTRVNVYPGLGTLHTIFVRYHNHVVDELATVHSDWGSDDLFYMARKIVIAVLQRITYSEYLTSIIGTTAMNQYGVSSTYSYDDSCDATLYNVFSTAAFRFGHSMVPDGLTVNGNYVNSIDLFNRPHTVLNQLDSLLAGMASSAAENADRWYSLGMTDHLFEESPHGGLDVASLNIQRGRDHGLPAYNKWRTFCGEDAITDFNQLPRHAQRRFRDVYGDPDDIDLYSGALTETGSDGVVGPTYACVLGKQFARLRSCDRYWWETTDPVTGFATDRQRRQIQRTKLSHVICLTTGISSIQERVFRLSDNNGNRVQTCSNILANAIDFSFF